MKTLESIARYFVGALFIFSGLVKLNDPIGTEIKLEEYFEVFSADFAEFFIAFAPYALELGFILIVLEIVLGIAVLINFEMKKTLWVLVLMISFFTFLTFYSAYFNKVTDCGCFGDAIPLTPWQSFGKDVILVVLIAFLYFRRNSFSPILSTRAGIWTISIATVLSTFIGLYAIWHLPYIDFRAYKVGDNVATNMQPEEAAIYEYQFMKDGEIVYSQNYLSEADGFTYVDYRVINPKKSMPKITDYNVWNDDEGDFTERSLQGTRLFVIIVDAKNASDKNADKLSSLITENEDIADPIILTSSDYQSIEEYRHEHQLAAPYFYADGVVLKAMIRSNPGIMLLKDGSVLGKWHYNDVPGREELLTLLTQ